MDQSKETAVRDSACMFGNRESRSQSPGLATALAANLSPWLIAALVVGGLSISRARAEGGAGESTGQPHIHIADLTPVTPCQPRDHEPVRIVVDGQAKAVIHVAAGQRSDRLQMLVAELVECIRLRTGAELKIVDAMPSADTPALVVGASAETSELVDAATIPLEGFRVLTAPNRVYLVGSTKPLPYPEKGIADKHYPYSNNGTAWAVSDFLERFVGVRWYWPVEAGGRSIAQADCLSIPPTHYADEPVFRMRTHSPDREYRLPWKSRWFDGGDVPVEFQNDPALKKRPAPDENYPSLPVPAGMKGVPMATLLAFLREGTSHPYSLRVHEPQSYWRRGDKWLEQNQDLFAVKADGTRNTKVFCYSSPATLAFLLDGCKTVWDEGGQASWVTASCVTVSPADVAVTCHCPACQKLANPGGWQGTGSRIMGDFLQRFAAEVERRWPDKKVIYLPYWNYAQLPEGCTFSPNLEVMLASNFPQGLAELRDEKARANAEAMLRDWSGAAGEKITTWEYSLSITGWVHAPVQFPHVVQNFYRRNRDVLAGSFLNGGNVAEWSRCAPTLYCWMKVLWNPEIDVDAVLAEMCRRLFGQAAEPTHALLQLMIDRYEQAKWPERMGAAGRVSTPIYMATWPPEVVDRMQTLRQQAETLLPVDSVERKRLDYWLWTFDAFLVEAKERHAEQGKPQ